MAYNNLQWNDVQSQLGNPAEYGRLSNDAMKECAYLFNRVQEAMQKNRELKQKEDDNALKYDFKNAWLDLNKKYLENSFKQKQMNSIAGLVKANKDDKLGFGNSMLEEFKSYLRNNSF